MNKLDMKSYDFTNNNLEKLKSMFPSAIIETGNGYKVDFEVLKQELSDVVLDEKKEKYELTWPGKKQAVLKSNIIETKTLRPLKDKSVNFDETKNIYIEGDNLEALKILQESYLNKIKCIYIDPPYNTGNDFIYNDNFDKTSVEELKESGQIDELGNRLITNNSSNGRFHSDWLSMMYPRLKLGRNLLTDDGVIFISIDDSELTNLKKICDEIFGENNFVALFCVNSNSEKNNSKFVSVSNEYILCYCKNKDKNLWSWKVRKNNVDEYLNKVKQLKSMNLSYDEIHQELLKIVKYPRFYDFDHYTFVDDRGVYRTSDAGGVQNGNKITKIIHPKTGKVCAMPSGGWRYKEEEINRLIENDMFAFGADETTIPVPKRYLEEFMFQVPKSNLYFDVQSTTKWLKKEKLPFDFPKSVDLLKYIIGICPNDSIVLDFFSGSATTAHAVMELNAEDNGNRKFIMIQIPEKCNEKSEAYKEGFDTICELAEERIRRSATKIEHDLDNNIDYGFRVYKVDSSNMKEEFYKPAKDVTQMTLKGFESNIKEDRSSEDLLTQVLLDLGVTLDLPIEEKNIGNNNIFVVDSNVVVACFDDDVNINIIEEIAKIKPLKVVFRDSSFNTDKDKINFEERLKRLSPDTEFNVL